MKYFLDTEFIEGDQKTWWGGKTKPTIDLISIGIVCEDGREYYAISKDFNLKEAWNRYDLKEDGFRDAGMTKNYKKVYWIRENVLKPLMQDAMWRYNFPSSPDSKFRGAYDFKDFKWIIEKYGKSNDQIAQEVKEFVGHYKGMITKDSSIPKPMENIFYGYYCDYDWVVFCWLFGKMVDLPTGFPMYCRDLKQMLDEIDWKDENHSGIKDHPIYPKQSNEHSAIDDARWNRSLHQFIEKL